MITGLQALLSPGAAAAARAFLSDVLCLPSIDIGGGWLVFAAPPAELAVHPLDKDGDGPADGMELYLMGDDIKGTVAERRANAVEITRPIKDAGYRLVTALRDPRR